VGRTRGTAPGRGAPGQRSLGAGQEVEAEPGYSILCGQCREGLGHEDDDLSWALRYADKLDPLVKTESSDERPD
jgi:hypothetical protein